MTREQLQKALQTAFPEAVFTIMVTKNGHLGISVENGLPEVN